MGKSERRQGSGPQKRADLKCGSTAAPHRSRLPPGEIPERCSGRRENCSPGMRSSLRGGVRLLSGQFRKSATSVRDPVSSHLTVRLREPRPHYASTFCEGEKKMATHSSVPAWRIPGTAEPGGLPSVGSHRVGPD